MRLNGVSRGKEKLRISSYGKIFMSLDNNGKYRGHIAGGTDLRIRDTAKQYTVKNLITVVVLLWQWS
jgi:hypothetical protein